MIKLELPVSGAEPSMIEIPLRLINAYENRTYYRALYGVEACLCDGVEKIFVPIGGFGWRESENRVDFSI
ncbi:MAG: hypothetical protein QOC72_623 [Methylobacteriaceae bacterium]|nr:hypothetical protein [Methylobacteriaceae bacterium]